MISALNPDSVSKPVVHHPIRTTSPRPKDGSQPSVKEKKLISSRPVRNAGMATPNGGICSSRLRSQRTGAMKARNVKSTAITIAITRAMRAISTEFGRVRAIIVATG